MSPGASRFYSVTVTKDVRGLLDRVWGGQVLECHSVVAAQLSVSPLASPAGCCTGPSHGLVAVKAARFAQPMGIALDVWTDRIIDQIKGVVRLLPVAERALALFGEDGANAAADWIERDAGGEVSVRLGDVGAGMPEKGVGSLSPSTSSSHAPLSLP